MHGFVARQPIFDGRGSLFAYELLFRPGLENVFGGSDHDAASASVIRNSLEDFGLEALTGGHRAFINVTRQVLVEGIFHTLPPASTVVELLETIDADDEVVAACVRLKRAGYMLALDDFVLRPALEPLLDFVDFVKVDVLATTASERTRWMSLLGHRPIRMLAEKVESRAQFEQSLAEGFTYFQGFYFQRPEMFSAQVIPPLKLNALRILRDLNEAVFELERVEAIVQQEAALADRLYADLNGLPSAGMKVHSVRQARQLLGEPAFRRWASLVALASLGEDRPPEFVSACLVRARFCELIAQKVHPADASGLFLVGLLSASDSLIGRPLSEILAQITLAPQLEDALLARPGWQGDTLRLVTSYERGDWAEVSRCAEALGVGEERVPNVFRQAVAWASQVWRRPR